MKTDELKAIMEEHAKFLSGNGGAKANLRGADLREADLRWANLSDANLSLANLRWANLRGADLREADLRWANLSDADLREANLREADLSDANLSEANLSACNLRGANLREADLSEANLSEADLRACNLSEANLSAFQLVPEEGSFVAWKKLRDGVIAKLEIPAESKRTSSLVGRKCRAEFAKVLWLSEGTVGKSMHNKMDYVVGEIVWPDKYDDDIRVECTHGIHFFITRKEAEKYEN